MAAPEDEAFNRDVLTILTDARVLIERGRGSKIGKTVKFIKL
jgi:hypothetical protein